MKTLQYKVDSWHYKLYNSTYDNKKYPTNICSYYKLLILAILIYPLAIVGHVYNSYNSKIRNRAPSILVAFMTMMIMLIWFMVYNELIGHSTNNILKVVLCYLLALGTFVGAVLFFFFGFYCIMGFIKFMMFLEKITKKHKRNKKPAVVKHSNPLKDGFKAFKGKYCSKIEWKS